MHAHLLDSASFSTLQLLLDPARLLVWTENSTLHVYSIMHNQKFWFKSAEVGIKSTSFSKQ